MSDATGNHRLADRAKRPRATAVILAGGGATRLGQDKAAALVAGAPLLQHVLAALPGDIRTILVGPPSLDAPPEVLRVQEVPPGGGPVAGLAAALDHVRTESLMLLAVDMPLGVPAAESALTALAAQQAAAIHGDGMEAMLPRDEEARAQPLCGAYQTAALRRVIGELPHAEGVAMRKVVDRLRVGYLEEVPAISLVDIDVPADLARIDKLMRDGARVAWSPTRKDGCTVMDEWIAAASAELDLEGEFDVNVVLDLARDVAHGVERPAAPVSTFLLGLAVGRGATLEDAAGSLTRLAATWNQT